MKTINVQYFALLRDEAGRETESFATAGLTYRNLYEELRGIRSFTLPPEMIQVAVNDEFVRMDEVIADGARVVFIPPVAGG